MLKVSIQNFHKYRLYFIRVQSLIDHIAAEFLKVAHVTMDITPPCERGNCAIVQNNDVFLTQKGDSGGPWFFIDSNGNPIQLGVHVLRRHLKSLQVNLLVYMSTSYHLNWIKENMK